MSLDLVAGLTEGQARERMERVLWPGGPVCPHCKAKDAVRIGGTGHRAGLLRCRGCNGQFTVTVGTIFEGSHIPLRKWLLAIHLMCSSKKGVSALQLQRNLSLGSYRSAWHMAHRIRYAMRSGAFGQTLSGTTEVDETYVGGKSRKGIKGRGSERKTPVVALVSREGEMRARVVERVNAKSLKGAIRDHVKRESRIVTDEWAAYAGIGKEFAGGHEVVRHKDGEYVRGDAHTNTAESWFALLKRGIHGTFHHVSKGHLPRYCDEFEFRWNNRKVSDGERAERSLGQCAGRRLMYRLPRDGAPVEHCA